MKKLFLLSILVSTSFIQTEIQGHIYQPPKIINAELTTHFFQDNIPNTSLKCTHVFIDPNKENANYTLSFSCAGSLTKKEYKKYVAALMAIESLRNDQKTENDQNHVIDELNPAIEKEEQS